MVDDPYRYFRIEARELVDQIGEGVLGLEREPVAPDLVAKVLRMAHTLKGAARVVRQLEIADRAHALEDILAPYREDPGSLPAGSVTRSLRLVDGINERLALLDAPLEEPAAAAVPDGRVEPRRVEAPPAVRADPADVDELLDAIGEVHAQLVRLRRGIDALENVGHLAELLAAQVAVPGSRTGESGSARGGAAARIRGIAAELSADLADLGRRLPRTVEQAARELHQVRGCAERLRLVPAGSIFGGLHRSARDVAEAQGKQVAFEGRGGQVRLDPLVLAEANAALLHVVRNAVAHGIESPQRRQATGKPAEGRVVVEVIRRTGHVAFTCTDDGLGFDLAAVRAAAERTGVAVPAGGDEALVDLLLRGGITTAGTVTEMSGRGIGLDVVRDCAERLGGEVTVRTEPGRGATVELAVPLSLVSLDTLVVDGAGTVAAIPLEAVRHTVRVRPGEVTTTTTGTIIVHNGHTIPYLPLEQVVKATSRPAAPPGRTGRAGRTVRAATGTVAVVVAGSVGTVALGVDRLAGLDTAVIRALPQLAPVDATIGGVSLDGEGNPRLVLDPDGLVARTGLAVPGAHRGGDEPAAVRRPILVIDDSLTTRMLERGILESAGYEVDVAASGDEGMRKAHTGGYALFLVDIEMPGMDGFTFVERTRADPELQHIPAILVSSRASPEDRRRGKEAGACLHVEKADFNQNELLDYIGNLVE